MIVTSVLIFIVTESRDNMKRFLTFQDTRILNIIQTIIVKDESLSIKEMMEMNECSQRTVYNDLHFIEEAWGDMVGFNLQGDILSFEERSMGIMCIIVESILKENLAMQIISELTLNSYQSIEALSKKLFVSHSRIVREINTINHFLRPYGFIISKKDKLYYWNDLMHDEIRIRIQLTRLIWEQTRLEGLISEIPLEILQDFATESLNKSIKLNNVQHRFLTLFVYVSYLREKQGFQYITPNKYKTVKHPIQDWMSDDIYHHFYASIQDFLNDIYETTIHNTVIGKIVNDFMRNMENSFKQDEMDILVDNLHLQIQYFVNYPYLGEKIFHREKLFGYRYAQQNPSFFKEILQHFQSFKAFTSVDLSDYVYEIIFHTAMLYPQHTIYHSRKILILSDYGENHAEILKKKVQQHFPNIKVQTMKVENYWREVSVDFEAFDLIVSTLPYPDKRLQNWVLVGDVLSDRDLSKIYQGLYTEVS